MNGFELPAATPDASVELTFFETAPWSPAFDGAGCATLPRLRKPPERDAMPQR